ncbi:gastrin-releasing peptide-like [Myxocyprinus asiaticus]|uniref:gastrin-releasing peptide-like n=1 Tax=Myxocyprinus asiaticus TaxID=70543 RepID=UPI002223955F|nr:gastrin-releasing peptide-like [Myxocyprinus asiaticus]
MGIMCFVWRYRLAVSVILVLVICDMHASDGAQPVGKVNPRGNHWAVGHLMGKKSTDERLRLDDLDSGGEGSMATPDQDLQPDRYTDPFLRAIMREQTEPEITRERIRLDALERHQRVLAKERQMEEESDRAKMFEKLLSRSRHGG